MEKYNRDEMGSYIGQNSWPNIKNSNKLYKRSLTEKSKKKITK